MNDLLLNSRLPQDNPGLLSNWVPLLHISIDNCLNEQFLQDIEGNTRFFCFACAVVCPAILRGSFGGSRETMGKLAGDPGKKSFNSPLCRGGIGRSLLSGDSQAVHQHLGGPLRGKNLSSVMKNNRRFAIAGPTMFTLVKH